MRWYGSSAIIDEIMTKSDTSAFNQPGLFEIDFPSYLCLMTAFWNYKSTCQLANHVVIRIKITGILVAFFKHCLWVFSTRHLGWLRCKSHADRADEIGTSWIDDNVGLQGLSLSLSLFLSLSEFDSLLFLHIWTFTRVDVYSKGKLEEKINTYGYCFRYPRLSNECALGPCRWQKPWPSRLE